MHFNCDRTSTIESNPDVDFLPHFNVVYLTIVESRPMGVDPIGYAPERMKQNPSRTDSIEPL